MEFLTQAGRLIAAELSVVEVATASSRRERRGEIAAGQAETDLCNLPDYFDELTTALPDADKALQLSLDLYHPFSDCLYLALALRLGLDLIAADTDFATKRSYHRSGHE